jgi:hypothetical protein
MPVLEQKALRRLFFWLGAVLSAYVAPLGYVALVTTPAYVRFPYFSVYIVPAVVSMLGLALLLSARAVRPMAWIVVSVLGVWLLENVGSIFWRLVQWERLEGAGFGDAFLGALDQSGSRAPYWLAILAPLLVAVACLRLTRARVG